MHLLVDESGDVAIVRTLREVGHDVLSIAETHAGATDQEVVGLAAREHRVLLTEDKDFGQLVYASACRHCGVILLRYPFPLARRISIQLADILDHHAEQVAGAFSVIQPGRTRFQRSPPDNPSS